MTNEKESLRERITTETVGSGPDDCRLDSRIEKSRTRRKSYVMDLRIHSPSSLGYLALDGIDTAPALVRLAKVKGLDVIAVTDYYSGRYIDRVLSAAKDTTLTVIPGVVIRCAIEGCRDVVLSCLFPESYRSAQIEDFLRSLGVPEAVSGDRGHLVDRPFEEILERVESMGGIAMPSRMDKTPYRKAALPALVEKYGVRVFDLAYYPESIQIFKKNWPRIKFHLLSFSSANALAQVGNRNSKVKLASPGFPGIRDLALRQPALETL